MLHLRHMLVAAALAAVVLIALAPTSALADDTGSVAGTVVDASGTAAADVLVRLYKPIKKEPGATGSGGSKAAGGAIVAAERANQKPLAEGKTDSDGKFTLSSIAPGDYFVFAGTRATAHGFAKVTVTAGAQATVNVTMKAAKSAKGDAQKPADSK